MIKQGDKVKVSQFLTTDPINKQGQAGVVAYRTSSSVRVIFEDGVFGNYEPDALDLYATAKELFEKIKDVHNLGRDEAGAVYTLPFLFDDGFSGEASYKWDGLHFYGEDANSMLLFYQNEAVSWSLKYL